MCLISKKGSSVQTLQIVFLNYFHKRFYVLPLWCQFFVPSWQLSPNSLREYNPCHGRINYILGATCLTEEEKGFLPLHLAEVYAFQSSVSRITQKQFRVELLMETYWKGLHGTTSCSTLSNPPTFWKTLEASQTVTCSLFWNPPPLHRLGSLSIQKELKVRSFFFLPRSVISLHANSWNHNCSLQYESDLSQFSLCTEKSLDVILKCGGDGPRFRRSNFYKHIQTYCFIYFMKWEMSKNNQHCSFLVLELSLRELYKAQQTWWTCRCKQ